MWNRLLLAHAAAALVCGQALAQEVRLYRQNDKVDPQEVASILGKGAAGQPPVKMRSIRLLDDAPSGSSSASASATSSAAAAAYGEPAPRPRTSALALPVQPLCREACAGLCPRCGADRNTAPCACSKVRPESPFAALASLRDTRGGR